MKRARIVGLAVACVVSSILQGCSTPYDTSKEIEGAEPPVADDEGEAYLPSDAIHAELEGTTGKDTTAALDHSWDDRVVPSEELDEPDNRFDDAEEEAAPGPTRGLAPPAQATSIDLRQHAKVIDQGSEGSCTAYAVAGAMQVLATASGRRDDMSAAHLWSLQGRRPNTTTSLNTALQRFVAPLSVWPNGAYSKPKVSNPDSYGFARLGRASTIPSGLSNVLTALASKKPVVVASTLNDSWRYMGSKGIIDPRAKSSGSWMHAAHAYDLVGYVKDARFEDGGYFIVKNSWGTRWGDKGYAYMPFSYCRHQRARADGRGYCLFYAVDDVELKGAAAPTPAPDPAPATSAYSVRVVFGELDGNNKDFRLELQASAADIAKVQKVVYDIHPTFGAAAQATSTNAATRFATVTYSTYASGWSTKGTKVFLSSGRTIALPGTTIRWK